MKKIYSIIFFLMLITSVATAQTRTWVGGTGATLNWTTPANWFPVGAPLATEDIVFSTAGVLTFTVGPGANFSFNSLTVSAGTVTLIGTGGSRTFTLGGNAGTDFTVASGASLTLGTNISITMANSATGSIAGTLTVNAGRTFNTNGTTVVTTVTGSIVNSGTVTCTSTAKLLMNSGSSYQHSQDAGTVPTATWNANSTLNITGMTGSEPSSLSGQTFGHCIWNCPGQSANMGSPATGLVFAGDLTIQNTSTFQFRFGQPGTNTIGGNFIMSGGNIRISSGTVRTVTVSGNVSISAGTLTMTDGTGIGTLNVAGNFSHTGGTITETDGTTGSGAIVFNGSSAQVFTSGGTVSNTINYTVNSGAILNMFDAATVVNGNSFILSSGGSLGITSTAGIVTAPTASGNIRTTTRTFNAGANYNYIGAGGAQATGNALPATINGLTVNNAAGVSLAAVTTVSSASAPLTLTNGILSGATLTVSAAYVGAGGGGSAASHVSSSLAKIGLTDYQFPVGNGTLYRPVSVSGLSGSATITASYTQANPQTTFGTALGAGVNHISLCEYWNLDDGAATITGIVGLQFGGSCNAIPYVDDPTTLLVAHWNGSLWEDKGTDGSATFTSVRALSSSTFSPFTIGSSNFANPLPVNLSNIRAFEKLQGIQIDWTAYQEQNLSHYSVERSADGIAFTSIGQVASLNSAVEKRYGFFDASPLAGVNFYRLRTNDIDGKFGYSAIVKVNLDRSVKDISLYPNPATGGFISFQGADLAKGNYTVKVYNSAGMQVMGQTFTHTGGAINQTLKLPNGIKSGMYSLQLVSDGVKLMSKTFIVQ